MKAAKWFVMGGFLILVSIVWSLYFYLNTIQNRNDIQIDRGTQQEELQLDAGKSSNYMLAETVQQFAEALYSGAHSIAAQYMTERGRAAIIPPGEHSRVQKVEARIVVHEIQIYEGTITAKHAHVIAAVKRTVTLNEIETISTHYIQLVLLKDEKWRIDEATVLADVPMR